MRKDPRVAALFYSAEPLERRELLSGVVTATLGLDGTLLLKGDAAGNAIDVGTPSPGIIRVQGNSTSINGVRFLDFTASSVARINMQLGDGSDTANVHDLALPDKITITDDKGNDGYTLSNITLPTGLLSVATGGGDDVVSLATLNVSSVTASTGGGYDTLATNSSTIASFNATTSDQDDTINIAGNTFSSLTIDAGNDDDNLSLSQNAVALAVNVKAGDGFDFVHADNTNAASGKFDGGGKGDIFDDGGGNSGFTNTGFEGNVTVTLATDGTLTIKGDPGNNNIEVSSPTAGIIRVAGNGTFVNKVQFLDFAASSVARINMQLGDGSDTANVHDLALPDKITITDDKGNDGYGLSNITLPTGLLSIATGGGDDLVSLDTLNVSSVTANTGSGYDILTTNTSTITTYNATTSDQDDSVSIAGNTFSSLTIDAGNDDDTLSLSQNSVALAINIKAGDGLDFVHADNINAASGKFDGGGKSDVFDDGGGNSGFTNTGFEGNVTVTLATDGTLTIKGDPGNNNIEVSSPAAGIIRVAGNGTFVNKVQFLDFTSSSIARINMQLGDGSDTANVHDLALPDKITITDNKGDDNYTVSNLSLPTGLVTIVATGGADDIIVTGVSAGSMTINAGVAPDYVGVLSCSLGSLKVVAGDNDDVIEIRSTSSGSIYVDAGKGNDEVLLTDVSCSTLTVQGGDGFDYVYVARVTASLGVIDGDGGSDICENGGGNSGFTVLDCEGSLRP